MPLGQGVGVLWERGRGPQAGGRRDILRASLRSPSNLPAQPGSPRPGCRRVLGSLTISPLCREVVADGGGDGRPITR